MSAEKEIMLLDRDLKRYIAACFAMEGLLAHGTEPHTAKRAVLFADALFAELDKEAR